MDGRLSRELEFEFVDGAGGGGFVVTDQVRGVIMAQLTRGEIDKAASQIASCSPEIGDQLLNEDAPNASRSVREAMAEAFVRARDFERAGRAALLIGDPGRAAPFFERSYRFAEAADLYEKGGKFERAAELHEQSLQYDHAARLYEQAGFPDRAAAAWSKAGQRLRAGQLWAKLRQLDKAVEVLQHVSAGDPDFAQAMWLLGRILERAGHGTAAVSRYIQVVKAGPVDAASVEVWERLAEIYVASNETDAARRLLGAVLKFDPARDKARRLAAQAGGMPEQKAAAPAPQPVPTAPSDAGRPSIVKAPLPSLRQPPTQDGVKPLSLPLPSGAQAPAARPPETVTAIHTEVDELRQLPLFAELSLDELRALHALGERRTFPPGAVLIEQDREGTDLFVILSGKVTVLHAGPTGQTVLGEFGYGSSMGEMALVDEGPTSARVVAAEQTMAFRWALDRFRRHLGTNEGTAARLLKVISRTLSVRLREASRKASEQAR